MKTKIKIRGKEILVDKSMANLIKTLNENKNIETLGCCEGHGKYSMTVVARISPYPIILEIFSNVEIPRKKRFYVKDKYGFYYIPEVLEKLGK